MHEFETLTLESEQGVCVLSFNRPKALNALNRQTLDELERALIQAESDPRIHGLILTGSGEKAFVAGADIKELAQLDADAARKVAQRGQSIFSRIENLPIPVIAAVNGFCLGGGCELAMSCHMRVASETARFGQPEAKLGLIPGYGGTQRLPRLVGRGRALEIILSGDMVSAQEALRIGLVNHVVPADQLIPRCRQLLESILANSPTAVRHTIEAVNKGSQGSLEEGLALEAALFGLSCASEDMREGTQAFLEKRKPRFRGE